MSFYADTLNAGEKLTIGKLELSSDYSYTESDVNNFLTLLPVSKKVIISNISSVPLTNSHWERWAQINSRWPVSRELVIKGLLFCIKMINVTFLVIFMIRKGRFLFCIPLLI